MRILGLLILALASLARADDLEALQLADLPAAPAEQRSDWRGFVEAAAFGSRARSDDDWSHGERLSLDLYGEHRFAPGWRGVLADRLDVFWPDASKVNTLKELYLSWQPGPAHIVDGGRINSRFGVASGYNPTDVFRADAVRAVVSPTPSSLRENRLGTGMLRGQTLWEGGSFTAIYAPKLDSTPDQGEFSPDWGATNRQNRWLLALSQQLSDGFSPQWLLFGSERGEPQLGANATMLLGDATVLFAEWAGGRTSSLLDQAVGHPGGQAFRSRLASGLTYTTSGKLSLTVEYEYNGAGLDRNGWGALRAGPAGRYWQYRDWVRRQQELPTRQALYFYASWQDAAVEHLDLTAMERVDWLDRSRMSWLEARYHWPHSELALQWQWQSGTAGSEYGALPQRSMGQVELRRYF
jgi:opacity protein-like surface antigen